MVYLTDLAETIRLSGMPVQEVEGWRKRGHGHMSDVRTITCHHTAGGRKETATRRSLAVVRDGRTGLPGPLAHLYLDRDGTWFIVAAGLCYHAGVSRNIDFTNAHAIGIEAEAAGDGWAKDWSKVQMESYAAGCSALLGRYGLPLGAIRGHKETCEPVGRKIDPSFSMTDFRRSVREWRKPPVPNPVTDQKVTPKEDTDDMLAYYVPVKDPKDSVPMVLCGDKLRHITGAEVGAIRQAGGTVRFVPLPANDPLWKLERI